MTSLEVNRPERMIFAWNWFGVGIKSPCSPIVTVTSRTWSTWALMNDGELSRLTGFESSGYELFITPAMGCAVD